MATPEEEKRNALAPGPDWDKDFKDSISYIDTIKALVNTITRDLSAQEMERAGAGLKVLYVNCMVLSGEPGLPNWGDVDKTGNLFKQYLEEYQVLLTFLNDKKLLIEKVSRVEI